MYDELLATEFTESTERSLNLSTIVANWRNSVGSVVSVAGDKQ